MLKVKVSVRGSRLFASSAAFWSSGELLRWLPDPAVMAVVAAAAAVQVAVADIELPTVEMGTSAGSATARGLACRACRDRVWK